MDHMIVPWKIPPVRDIGVIFCIIGGIIVSILCFYYLAKGDLLKSASALVLLCFFGLALADRLLKKHTQELFVLRMLALLIATTIPILYIQNFYFRMVILLVSLALGFFVLLGVYSVFCDYSHG